MEDLKREIDATEAAVQKLDAAISASTEELGKASSVKSNIAANLRYRKELKEIEKVQEELDGIDLVQAARSRREFNLKYSGMLEEEKNKQSAVSHLVFSTRGKLIVVEPCVWRACADVCKPSKTGGDFEDGLQGY